MTPLLLLAALFAVPRESAQGRVIRVTSAAPMPGTDGFFAMLDGKRFPIFFNAGSALGLIPVGVFQKPGPYDLEIRASDGTVVERHSVAIRATPFRKQNIRATKRMKALRPAPGEVERMRALAGLLTKTRYFEDEFVPPTEHCQNSPFGVQRLHNGRPTGNYHRGADQRSPAGAAVHAPASGVVAVAAPEFQVNGGTVGLDHGQGLTSHYIHLSRVAVREGQKVLQGDVIGYVGATGFATAAHLHWGIVVHGTPVDPNEFVALQPCGAPATR